jgi:hypothetical protein
MRDPLRDALTMAALRGLARQRRQPDGWALAVWAAHAGRPWAGSLPPALPALPDAVDLAAAYDRAEAARRAAALPRTAPPAGWMPARRAS